MRSIEGSYIAKRDLTRVRFAGRLTVVLLMSLVFLCTYPRTLLLSTLHIDLLIPREVIRDVNTKILLGRDIFKLRAGHMIDKDDGFKFPSDAALLLL